MVWINQRASEEDCIATTNFYSAVQADAQPASPVVKKTKPESSLARLPSRPAWRRVKRRA